MTVALTIELSEHWLAMLVRMTQDMRGRGHEVTPEQLVPALMRLGLRAAGAEACGTAAASFDLSQLTDVELDQLDSALLKIMLHGVAGAP